MPVSLIAENHANEEHHETKKEGFSAGDFIFDHIRDSYNWHLFSYKGRHVAIPLPVILYSKTQGLVSFWSFKLDHGNDYKGFKIAHEGNYKDKIIEVDNHGEFIARPFDISITKNVTAILFSCIFLAFIFVSVANSYKKREGLPPKGLQSLLEPLILFIRDDVAKSSIGEKHYEKYTPFLLKHRH